MISYRKLAMRVLGHPLRVPTNTSRPASHRVTALALTAAMVAGMAAPAYAGTYYIDNNGGDITVTKDAEGNVYVKRSNKTGYANELGEKDEDNNVIIKSGAGTDTTKNPTPAPVLPKAAPPAAALPKAAPLQPLPPNPRRPRSK